MAVIINLYDSEGREVVDVEKAYILETNNLKGAVAFLQGNGLDDDIASYLKNSRAIGGVLIYDGKWRLISKLEKTAVRIAGKSRFTSAEDIGKSY